MKTKKLFTIAAFCAAILFLGSFAEACTGITLRAANGDVVFCRTMEWDAGFVPSEILVYPRNHTFEALMPESMPGMSWKGKYGIAGLAVIKVNAYVDAMNEKGLIVGMFYHEGYAEYAKYSKDRADRSISSVDVAPYILSTCATIDEAKQAMEKVELVHVEETPMGFPLPLHYMITEPNGKQVVLEYVDGKPKFFDSKVGTIANSPTYDWHLTNLGNYTRLPSPEVLERKMGDYTAHALDTGTDLIGLPGDYTSPSRFVRAAVLSHYVRKTPDAKEAVYQAFQVMDSFNVPVYGGGLDNPETNLARSETYWTLAHDLTNRTFYYHTSSDRTAQKVDVSRIDFEKLAKPIRKKLDKGEMTVIDRTDEIERKPISDEER